MKLLNKLILTSFTILVSIGRSGSSRGKNLIINILLTFQEARDDIVVQSEHVFM